jgi:hypothetical protein
MMTNKHQPSIDLSNIAKSAQAILMTPPWKHEDEKEGITFDEFVSTFDPDLTENSKDYHGGWNNLYLGRKVHDPQDDQVLCDSDVPIRGELVLGYD